MTNEQKTSPEFSDASIRRFLLGRLEPREQATFEEELFRNLELEARVRLAELELADDHAFRLLTDSESKRFLVTAGRNQQVQVSSAIRERLARAAVRENSALSYRTLASLLNLRRPAWRYAFAALLLFFILAMGLLITKEPQIVRKIIPGRFRPGPQPTATPQVAHHASNTSSPVHVEQRQVEPPHESPVVVSLNSTTAIEQAPVSSLPAGDQAVVRFQLLVESEKTREYRAEVVMSSGETIFRTDSLKLYDAKASSIDFDVPAAVLKSGQYLIRLTQIGDGSPQVAQYYFRIP